MNQFVDPATRAQTSPKQQLVIDLLPEEFHSMGRSPDALPPSEVSFESKVKKTSPKRVQELLDHTRSDVEAARHASALRGEERRRLAQESRLDVLQEMKKKSSAEIARFLEAKKRRDKAIHLVHSVTQDKQMGAIRRSEEARQTVMKKAQKYHSRIDEIRFTNETRNMEKQLLLNKKMNAVEQHLESKREERQRQAQVKNDAIRAAAERRRNLSAEREEKQIFLQYEREAKEKRVKEFKETEQKSKLQKSEEWERKIQQHQLVTEAETLALEGKTREKFRQSESILAERREQLRKKIEAQERKLKEAKERREQEIDCNFSYKDVMASYDVEDEETLFKKLLLARESSQKQNKSFSESYRKANMDKQRECEKCRIKPTCCKLASLVQIGSISQCRPSIADIFSSALSPSDHEYIRYSNSLETITQVILAARKSRHAVVVKQSTDCMVQLFHSGREGLQHAAYFVRGGLAAQLIISAHDEANTMRKNSLTLILTSLLNCVAHCMEVLVNNNDSDSQMSSVREAMINETEKLALDRIYFVILKMCFTQKDLELTFVALRIITAVLSVNVRRKGESKRLWQYCLAVSLFALLQNIVGAGAGNPIVPRSISFTGSNFTCAQLILVLFALRILNTLARWRLGDFQEMFHATSSHSNSGMISNSTSLSHSEASFPDMSMQITRMELYHFLSKFFQYVHEHVEHLETIEAAEVLSKENSSESFCEAERFGLTLNSVASLLDLKPTDCSVQYLPGGKCYPLRATLHECILLVGYLTLDDKDIQEIFAWGKGTTLLDRLLVALPAPYFTNARHILFPTVLSIIENNDRNREIVQNVMEFQLLRDFLDEEFKYLSKKSRQYAEKGAQTIALLRRADEEKNDVDDQDGDFTCPDETPKKGVVSVVNCHSRRSSREYGLQNDEKEKFIKSFKNSQMDYTTFFKFEKRVPISFWPLLTLQLLSPQE